MRIADCGTRGKKLKTETLKAEIGRRERAEKLKN
jgi:hypothetical protein